MAIRQIELATIHLLDDGTLQKIFDDGVRSALADCEDRPLDDSERKVILTFAITPIGKSGRQGERVSIDASIQVKIPAMRTNPTEVQIRRTKVGVQGVFNDMSRDNVDQGTLDMGNTPNPS
jgi:hypothetical protein